MDTKFKKSIFYIILLLISNTAKMSDGKIYKSIAKENLKSLTNLALEENGADSLNSLISAEKKFYEVIQEKLEQQLNPKALEKRKQVFNLISELEDDSSVEEKENQVLDEKTWQDLEILCGPKSNPQIYLASQIDRTITEIGKVCLYKKIVQPTADPKQLVEQQKIIKELINNKNLFNLLDASLKDLAIPENAILSFWQEDIFENMIKQQNIILPIPPKIKDKISKCESLQEFLSRQQFFNEVFSSVIATIGVGTLGTLGVLLMLEQTGVISPKAFTQKFKDFNATFGISAASTFGLFFVLSKLLKNEAIEGNLDLGGSLLEAIWLPHKYYHLKSYLTIYKCMEEKLTHVALFIKNLTKMILELQKHKEAKHLHPLIQTLRSSITNLYIKSNDAKHLLQSLNTKTFEGESSAFFSRWGRIYVVYNLMCELKQYFIPVLSAVGQLDTYMSIAKLYKEFENKQVKFCFPEYDFSTKIPSINIENFWNPFINPQVVVPNSLSLGEKYNSLQNIIISGPNAGGKSTITKALIISIILAQGIGISPADKLTFTPFNKIVTYLNITDDIAAGNSHFKAGVIRSRELNQIAESLKDEEISLMAVDELFNGTTYKEGQAAAYTFIKRLGYNPKNICVTASHFPKVTNLEQETGLFTNYKVSVLENGKLQYPFKLEKGISNQIITFKILKEEGFGDDFLDEAEKQLKNMKNH